jgi:hypothetical protein
MPRELGEDIDDALVGAIVDAQLCGLRAGKSIAKRDVRRRGAAEAVDGLAGITDDPQLRPSPTMAFRSRTDARFTSWYSSTSTCSWRARKASRPRRYLHQADRQRNQVGEVQQLAPRQQPFVRLGRA